MVNQGRKTIIIPSGEQQYRQMLTSAKSFRMHLDAHIERHPELFPSLITSGYNLIGWRKACAKINIARRRIRLRTSRGQYEDYTVHPCYVFPYLRGRTVDLSRGLLMRKHCLPYSAVARLEGKDSMFWYRAEMALARNSIIGTTVKKPQYLAKHILVDEHHCYLRQHKVYICTSVGAGCFLGAALSPSATAVDFQKAYGVFKAECLNLDLNYNPLIINIDGYKSTRKAMDELFVSSACLCCFLHGYIKIRTHATKQYDAYQHLVADKVWHCYRAPNRLSFLQRMAHLKTWTQHTIPQGAFKSAILKLCEKAHAYALFYDFNQAQRTSNMIDRLMRFQERKLQSNQQFHGTLYSANQAVRAHALLVNFCPYDDRTLHNYPNENYQSPFERLNQIRYRDNWLENLIVAASLGGYRQ